MSKAKRKAVDPNETVPAGYIIAEMLKKLPLNVVVEATMNLSNVDEAMALEIVYAVQQYGPTLEGARQ
ncbi:MAG TPA: hypothetical protein VK788_06740 [Terriglobales bacterium]|jgi:hypothetical protein|nr:hypothetical protein [Terriglobales bacterium]